MKLFSHKINRKWSISHNPLLDKIRDIDILLFFLTAQYRFILDKVWKIYWFLFRLLSLLETSSFLSKIIKDIKSSLEYPCKRSNVLSWRRQLRQIWNKLKDNTKTKGTKVWNLRTPLQNRSGTRYSRWGSVLCRKRSIRRGVLYVKVSVRSEFQNREQIRKESHEILDILVVVPGVRKGKHPLPCEQQPSWNQTSIQEEVNLLLYYR